MTLMVGLGCGAKAPSPEKNFRSVLRLRYVDDAAAGSSSYEQRARSTFQLCKWSSLEVIGREVFDERRANVGVDFALELCDAVFEDVQNSTYEVVGPLFEVGLMATEFAPYMRWVVREYAQRGGVRQGTRRRSRRSSMTFPSCLGHSELPHGIVNSQPPAHTNSIEAN